jgi:cell division protein FtsN
MRKNGYSMGRDNGNKSAAPRNGGNSLWTGMLVGIVVGVGMAAGVAWYLMKSPSPFLQKGQLTVNPPTDAAKSPPPAGTKVPNAQPAVSGDNGKPRFEFYKVLTDKQDATAISPSRPADKPKPADKSQPAKPQPADSKLAVVNEPQILQAGSFSNVSDAENLKAKLALLGVEANIQTATIPDKGVWYRVRLGPYKNTDEMNHARGFLKQNGVDSTPMRAQ